MAGTDCFAPRILAGLLCCFSLCFYSITITRVFNGVVVFIKLYVSIFIRLIDFDLTAHIRSILQLFHDNSIMVFNAICCFDKAVVVGRIIFLFFNRGYWLAIVIPCAISIHQRFIGIFINFTTIFIVIMTIFNRSFLLPFISSRAIVRIAFVMTKGHSLCFISCCLVTNSSSKMIKNLEAKIVRIIAAYKKARMCTFCLEFFSFFFSNRCTCNTCVSYGRLIPSR